jgi:SAM-dependent methyltransferase
MSEAAAPTPIGTQTMSPAMKKAANYYAWIADKFRPLLGSRVLDVGGGHGPHLEHVVAPGRFVMSLDLSPDCVAAMASRFANAAFEARVGDITDPSVAESLADRDFDTILCVNVLEHIADDLAALVNMRRILAQTGGKLFLFVPAHRWLFGTPDQLAGHLRRYSRKALVERVVEAQFRVSNAYYFNSLGAIPYFVNARMLRPRTLGGSVDAQIVVYDRIVVPLLRRVERFPRLPFGQSLIAVGEASK